MDRSKKTSIKIVTFNVHFGEKIKAIATAFTQNKNLRAADIIFLQEIEDHESETVSRAEKLAAILGLNHAYAPAREIKTKGTHGLAILSKYDLTNIKTIALPTHSFLSRSRKRIAMTAIADVHGTRVILANIHLDTRLNSAERIAQVKVLVDKLKKDYTQKIIVGGDFNMLPFYFYKSLPFFYHNQKRRLHQYFAKEGFSCHCENGGYTFKRGFIQFELDGIYTRNAKVRQCGVERSVAVSDHKPVWLDVDLDANTVS
jgi:endonuclease/exonuclease/phosphatase family metal-dependent hydrolase